MADATPVKPASTGYLNPLIFWIILIYKIVNIKYMSVAGYKLTNIIFTEDLFMYINSYYLLLLDYY